MAKAYTTTGNLSNGRVVRLDEPVPLPDARVRIMIEPFVAAPTGAYAQVIGELRQRQAARGHLPPTRDEVDAYVRAERDSWGE